jgi:hypothetical protein
MTDWLRPLAYVGLWVVPAGLMIVVGHPWLGVAAFVAVLPVTLAHSRSRARARVARDRLSTGVVIDLAARIPALSAPGGVRIGTGGEPQSLRARDDQLIHFPPRRL